MIRFIKRLWAYLFPSPQDWIVAARQDALVRPASWKTTEDGEGGFVLTNLSTEATKRTSEAPGAMIVWTPEEGVVDAFVFGVNYQATPLNRADRKLLNAMIEDWNDSVVGGEFWVDWELKSA